MLRVDPDSGAQTLVSDAGLLVDPQGLTIAPDGTIVVTKRDLIDFPADAGCSDKADVSERPACSDGLDDDADALADWPADPGCRDAASPLENPACDDGIDNDGDSLVDAADPQCTTPYRNAERRGCGLGAELVFVLFGVATRLRSSDAGR